MQHDAMTALPSATGRDACTDAYTDGAVTEQALLLACQGEALPAIISRPAEGRQSGPRGVLVIVGGPQYKAGSHRQFTLLARALAAQGIPVLRFDYRGMGDGGGVQRTFDDVHDDVAVALDAFIAAVPGLREVALWGLCDGATAAVLHGARDPRVTGMVLLNPWARDEAGLAKAMLKHYYLQRLRDPALWKKIASGRFDARAALRGVAQQVATLLRRKASPPEEATAATVSGPGDGVAPISAVAAAPAPSPVSAPVSAPAPAPIQPLPARLYDGLRAFTGPVLLIISPGDMTAMEFLEAANSSAPWRKLMAAPRITRRDLPGANHTFASRAWRDQVAEWTGHWLRSW